MKDIKGTQWCLPFPWSQFSSGNDQYYCFFFFPERSCSQISILSRYILPPLSPLTVHHLAFFFYWFISEILLYQQWTNSLICLFYCWMIVTHGCSNNVSICFHIASTTVCYQTSRFLSSSEVKTGISAKFEFAFLLCAGGKTFHMVKSHLDFFFCELMIHIFCSFM